jgi:hypothetical protein
MVREKKKKIFEKFLDQLKNKHDWFTPQGKFLVRDKSHSKTMTFLFQIRSNLKPYDNLPPNSYKNSIVTHFW